MIRSVLKQAVLAAAVWTLCSTPSRAKTFATQSEALARAFPSATVERVTAVLSPADLARVAELSGEQPASALVYPYRAYRDGRLVGTAYFDVHKVRTLPATVMILVGADGRLGRVEVLAFNEPQEYMASDRWNAQFNGRALDDNLQIKRDISGIAGATLTARATTRAVRRILAVHQVLGAAGPAAAPRPPKPEAQP